MITDRDKLDRLMRKLRKILEEELDDDYTGAFRLDCAMQNGNINGRVLVGRERG